MKNFLISYFILLCFSFSAFAQVNPFSKFQGKYESQSCKCFGVGKDQFSYEPCNLVGIEVRSYKALGGQTTWVLDEIFATKYTVRPLDAIAIKPMLSSSETVSTNLSGNANSATVSFTSSKGGVSTYQIAKSIDGYQYGGGFKGVGPSGVPIDVQCFHKLIKK